MKKLLLILMIASVSMGALAKTKVKHWICASADDGQSLYVELPSLGIPFIQFGAGDTINTDVEDAKSDIGNKGTNFRYEKHLLSILKDKSQAKNQYYGLWYDFTDLPDGETKVADRFYTCAYY